MWNVLGKYHCCFSSKEKGRKPRGKRVRNEQIVHNFTSKGDSTTRVYIHHELKTRSFLAQIWLESTLDGLVLLFHATNPR